MVTLHTNRPERTRPGARWLVAGCELVVTAVRSQGGRFVVHFDGIDDRTAAEALRGCRVFADPLGPLSPDELWVHELIGSLVVGVDGRAFGRVDAVEANPAHDLLVLDSGALVPMVFVVDATSGRLVIDPPAGLLDEEA